MDKQQVIEQANAVMETCVLFLDTETTGFSKKDVALEIGVVTRGGRVAATCYVQSKPSVACNPNAFTCHGISSRTIQNAPLYADLREPLIELLRGADLLVAYNAAFDKRILQQTEQHHGFSYDFDDVDWVCAQEMCKAFHGKRISLTNFIAEYQVIAPEKVEALAHSADGDAVMTREVVQWLANQ